MSATWTCICGKSFNDYGAVAGDVLRCPECRYVVGEAVPSRYDERAAMEAEAAERIVLASPEVAVQATDPLVTRATSLAIDETAEPDIRIKSIERPYVMWVLPSFVAIFFLALGIGFFSVGQQGPGQKDAALWQIHGPLTQACQAFRQKHGEFPETLDKLLERDQFGQIYLDKPDALIDPWGKHYQYDPKGPRNDGEKPDIWTVHADGTVIGNWPKQR
jgi:hypothetical protein